MEEFFSRKRKWFGENVLGEDKAFTGNTGTVTGTLCHHSAEVVANCKLTSEKFNSERLTQSVEEYIAQFSELENYDIQSIRTSWKPMAEALVKAFVINSNIIVTELYAQIELLPNIFVAGTMDAIISSSSKDTADTLTNPFGKLTLVDYKTSSVKASSFSYRYLLQAMCYCYMLWKEGIKVTSMELQFVTKATKTLPIRTYKFTKPFGDREYAYIRSLLLLVADSVKMFKEVPELRYIIANDYRLKIDNNIKESGLPSLFRPKVL